MKNSSVSKTPLAAFSTPPHAPTAVAEARAKFDAIGDKWGRTRGELEDAQNEARGAKLEDAQEVADRVAAGKKLTESEIGKREREAHIKITSLERQLAGISIALDKAGNDFAIAIDANRDEWLVVLEPVTSDAEARYAAALEAAQAALADLKPARGALNWLRDFSAEDARVGRQTQFSGGRLTVRRDRLGPLHGEHNPDDVLKLAATLLDPPERKVYGGDHPDTHAPETEFAEAAA
jgi:hypothetical protein